MLAVLTSKEYYPPGEPRYGTFMIFLGAHLVVMIAAMVWIMRAFKVPKEGGAGVSEPNLDRELDPILSQPVPSSSPCS